ncbi:MAG: hypothetical protein QNJ54_24445 [Prochloraceae cyanobacterium]|nr:hypothetical protein [Prochloraceae cyanobacterium]
MRQKPKQVYDSGCTYEWRIFWSDVDLIPPLKQMFMLQIPQKKQSWGRDKYLLVENCPHNIKVRNGLLQIKKFLDTYNGYQIFAQKKSLRFPLSSDSLADVLSEMKGKPCKIKDFKSLELLLEKLGHQYHLIDVKKKRYKLKLQQKTILDIGYIIVDGQPYWSVCLEANKPKNLLSPSEKIFFQENCIEGYIDFFQRIKLGK